MLVLAVTVAQAGELESFVGGAASGGITAFSESDFASADGLTTQVELDVALGWGWGHTRVDWDFHVDPNTLGDEGADFFAYPSAVSDTGQFPMPEWAMVQFGREKHARVGLFNPNLGVEDWDPWINYAPTYSNNFVYVGSGRFLGADLGLSTDSGYDVFAFGGYDVDWASFGGGAGVATAQDAWSTWSGILVYPEFAGGGCPDLEETCLNLFGQLAFEFYPADPLWIAVEAYPGVKGDAFYTSTQLVANIVPEAVVNPFVRGELLFDPDEVTGAPASSVSIGARSDTPEWLRLMVEGKAVFLSDDVTDLGVAVTIAVHRPEPNAYSYTDPFGAEEE